VAEITTILTVPPFPPFSHHVPTIPTILHLHLALGQLKNEKAKLAP
jgi:hypothetical protein